MAEDIVTLSIKKSGVNNMTFMIRHKIIGLIIATSFMLLMIIIIVNVSQKGTLSDTVATNLDDMGRDNYRAIASDLYKLCETTNSLVRDLLVSNLHIADHVYREMGGVYISDETVSWQAVNQFTKESKTIFLPKMMNKGRWLGKNRDLTKYTPIVDDVYKLVGHTCTVFQRMNEQGDMLRVATNVRKQDQTRAIGTYIPAMNPDGTPNEVIRTVMRGETYIGRAYVVNAWYQTAYQPIRNDAGRIIGILYYGVKQDALKEIREAIMDITIGKTGYVYVLGGKGKEKGEYIISKDGARDGENIWDAKDADGRLFIQSIINKAVKLQPGEIVYETYPWKNEGDRKARLKTVAIAYYEPWDWVIGAGTYHDDFYDTLNEMNGAISGMLLWTIGSGIVVLVLVVIIGLYVANRIAGPLENMRDVAINLARGDINQEVTFTSRDETGHLADSFRDMIQVLRNKAQVAEDIAAGKLDADMVIASEDDVLGKSMKSMVETIDGLQSDLNKTIERQKAGALSDRCHPDLFQGAFAELAQGVNDVLDALHQPIEETIERLREYADGDLGNEMRELPGEQINLTNALNEIRKNVKALIDEGIMLAHAAEEGNLEVRGDAGRFRGGYREIIEGMNSTIENLLRPLSEAVKSLSALSEGDMTVTMEGDYKGDHAKLKLIMNKSLSSLNALLGEVATTIDQVSNGSRQVSDSSQSVSQGATEQASSLEEITASMTEIGSQSKQNAENASQANQLSSAARDAAQAGSTQVEEMLGAMSEINDSAGQISRIIKVIEEIAFQTNLLALNAAVEAARAGVHGKGFAVVAEEVRNLAQRSAKAADETTVLIENSVEKARKGSDIANQSAEALYNIIEGITRVSDLIGEIASASQEQVQGLQQVNQGLSQIDQVTQSNTANAEESAAASEELSGQAERLKVLVNRFKMENGTGQVYESSFIREGSVENDEISLLPENNTGGEDKYKQEMVSESVGDRIELDDDDFGNF